MARIDSTVYPLVISPSADAIVPIVQDGKSSRTYAAALAGAANNPLPLIDAAIAAHELEVDPHSVYATQADLLTALTELNALKALHQVQTATITTGLIAVGGYTQVPITLSKLWIPIEVETSHPAEVRIYQSVADQALDLPRPSLVEPLLRMIQFTTGEGFLSLVPSAREVFGSPTFTSSYPVTIFNRHPTGTPIALTVKYMSLEN